MRQEWQHMSWQIDPYHVQVEFSVKHLGMMTVRGHFTDVTARGTIDPDRPSPDSIDIAIDTSSVRTNNPTRDNDIRGANFLDVEHFPEITFKSTSIRPTGDTHFALTGDLTIKNVTRPVTLNVQKYGEFNDPGMFGHRIAYSAEAQISRKDFGLTMNMVLDGRLVVGDEIKIEIELELVEQKVEAEAATAGAR
jgi:polyisoprenoid-binding protein YceI